MTPNSPSAPRPASPVTLASLARSVRRFSLVFALFVIAAVLAGAGVWFFLPLPQWTAAVTYHVSAEAPGVLNSSASQPLNFTSYKQQQAALLRTKVFMTSVLSDPAVSGLPMIAEQEQPAEMLSKNLQIEYQHGPEYMRLSLEGNDPVQLVTLMKAVSAAFLKDTVSRDRGGRLGRLEQLRKTAAEYDSKLRDGRNKITNAMKRLKATDPGTLVYREQFLERQLSDARSQLANVVLARREAMVQATVGGVAQGAVQPPAEVADATLDDLVRADNRMIALQAKLAEVDAKLKDAKSLIVPGQRTATYNALIAEKTKVEADLKSLPIQLKPEIAARLKTDLEQLARQKAANYKDRIALFETFEKRLQEDIDKLLAERKDLTDVVAEVNELRGDMVAVENTAAQVAAAIESIKPELDAPMRVKLWEEPTATPGIEGKRRTKYTLMAFGGVLMLGLVLVQWLEYRARRVLNAEELSASTGLAVIGTVPYIPKETQSSDRELWAHLLTEAVNTTRTMILNPRAHPDLPSPRTILITSAMSGEGKTSISTHLAVSLAGAGRRVLLIDADMRRPTAHAVLGIAKGPGLCEYLLDEIETDTAIIESRVPNLHFLPAGRWSPAAAAALTTGRWSDLLHTSSAQYDIILIDSPPILPVADALSIARTVDGVLVAVMSDWSRFASVVAACNRLQMVQARVLGMVLSGTRASRGYYYNDSYYRSKTEPQVSAS